MPGRCNQKNIAWMQQASVEARTLRAGSGGGKRRNNNTPVSLSVEQTANSAGLKDRLSKIESSGKDSARVTLEGVAFNQMVVWLNTLEQSFGIYAGSVTIERNDKTGFVDARLTLTRP